MMNHKPIPLAICYDFDGTLAPGNMQEHNFLPDLGISSEDFWHRTQALAEDQDADGILAYMRLMLDLAREAKISVKREDFRALGAKLTCYPGLDSWFDRVNRYALVRGLEVRHYIISSGLREIIEGSAIATKFERIYASGYMYDENGVAIWPALAINYTTKTQFLFRINKGTHEVYDNTIINKFVPKNERPIPFENMVYIGDGETDIPCFRLVKEEGGYSMAVYEKDNKAARERVEQLTSGGRVTKILEADYREESEMEKSIQAIVDSIAVQD